MSYESKLKALFIPLILLTASVLPRASLTWMNALQQPTQFWRRIWGGSDEDAFVGVAVGSNLYIVGGTGSSRAGLGDASLAEYGFDIDIDHKGQPDAYHHDDYCGDNPWVDEDSRSTVTADDPYNRMSRCEATRMRDGIVFWTEGSTVKIRPFDPPGSDGSIHIRAAKNEYEAFQVAVTAPGGLKGVDATVSDLVGGEGTVCSENIRLYREVYMNVVKPSNIDGETGLWPDALIPDSDPFFNETRNAFPFDVPEGQNRAIWVDVFVPPTTSAGTYTGNLTFTASGRNPTYVPVMLTVWDFALPSTSSLTSAFGFDGWELLVGHYGSHEPYDQIVPLSKLYAESGLMHRISLESETGEDWSIHPSSPTAFIDWTEFDADWGPFLDGIDLPYGLKGSKLTSIRLDEWGDTEEERISYWQQYASHFKEKGWFDRLFDYTWDEPSEDWEFAELKERSYSIERADPDLRVLATTNIQHGMKYDLIDAVDIWVPIINEMHGKPGSEHEGNQRDDYDELLAAGDELWWYQSCESHGCYWIGSDEYSMGWPSYMIDIPAIYNRIMEWQSFKYNISGELYYSTNYAFEFNDDGSNDPWNTLYYFGGNGDGTLFYPGRTDKIGGMNQIPIESIRLKMIREGMEDYEYMKMLQDLGEESLVRNLVDSVLTNAYTFSHDPATLYTAREEMARGIFSYQAYSHAIPTLYTNSNSKSYPHTLPHNEPFPHTVTYTKSNAWSNPNTYPNIQASGYLRIPHLDRHRSRIHSCYSSRLLHG